MAAADLILCRAGASTISELSYMGKPVLMVPSPNVTNNHQEKNARVLEHAGGAVVLLEGEFDADSLLEEVRTLLADEQRLESMGTAMRTLAVPDACERIVGIILDVCK
jgi:UDP-N-acetylglucosamine--N-acetylmuramyl-(pentapeptide) pyrophosphoryl-undecaprenol N-acetylglucosamine transferase